MAGGLGLDILHREKTMTTSPKIRLTAYMTAFCLLANSTPALAQITTANQIIGCQSIENDISRLDCFDQIAERLNKTSKPEAPKVAPSVIQQPTNIILQSTNPKTATETTAQLETPDVKPKAIIQDFGKDASEGLKPTEAALLTPKGKVIFSVKHVQIFDHVKKRFYMTNNQVWEQTTARDLNIKEGPPPKGTTVTISHSGFGGYKLRLNDKKSRVKVKRVR